MSRNLVSSTGGELVIRGLVRAEGLGVELGMNAPAVGEKDPSVTIPLDGAWTEFVLMPKQHVDELIAAAAARPGEPPPRDPEPVHTGEATNHGAQQSEPRNEPVADGADQVAGKPTKPTRARSNRGKAAAH